jgi:hypothetical protein
MQRHITAAAVTVLCLSGCVVSPPPLGAGLSHNYTEASPAFDQRIKNQYPVGSSEDVLRAELHNERFQVLQGIDPTLRYWYAASFDTLGAACRNKWTVWWNADRGTITEIAADYDQVCL